MKLSIYTCSSRESSLDLQWFWTTWCVLHVCTTSTQHSPKKNGNVVSDTDVFKIDCNVGVPVSNETYKHEGLYCLPSGISHQLQMASTETFFMTFGHGSPPKISGVMGTAQDCWPTQYLSKTSKEWNAWQLPCWKLPQEPSGVPKLANLMDEIF